MFRFIGFFALATIVAANDLTVGAKDIGRKIIDEERIASPAFWVQTANVTYSTNNSEVISRVVVTDCRSDKDGSARIVEGGEGHKNVTIELKSPTLLRGYDFLIEVYAVDEDNQSITTEQSNSDITTEEGAPKVPISLSGDTLEDNLRKSRKTDDESSTLNGLDITTVVPADLSTQAASDQSTPKPDESEKSKELDTPISIGKDEKHDVSTTLTIISPTVTLPTDGNVYPDVNKSEVTKDDQNKSDEENKKPVLSESGVHKQFRDLRDSGVTAVEETDYVTLTTSSSGNGASTKSSSIVETDVTTQQSSSEAVSSVDTSKATVSEQDVIGLPRVLISDGNDQRFTIPIPYNH